MLLVGWSQLWIVDGVADHHMLRYFQFDSEQAILDTRTIVVIMQQHFGSSRRGLLTPPAPLWWLLLTRVSTSLQ